MPGTLIGHNAERGPCHHEDHVLGRLMVSIGMKEGATQTTGWNTFD
jgi:hypothetical protein